MYKNKITIRLLPVAIITNEIISYIKYTTITLWPYHITCPAKTS
jgi:hypothetical protein